MSPIGARCWIKWPERWGGGEEYIKVGFTDFDPDDDIFYCTLDDIKTKPFPCDDFEIISYQLIYEKAYL
jgi:hypothetical protein